MGYQRRVHGECLLAGSAGYTHSSIMGENEEIWKAAAMADHFDKIQKLTEKIDGVPNFRRVPGYKVYCCGQPTIAGFEAAINKACGETYPKTNKIIWLNMRQEPIVYVNGNPICARPPNKIGEYAELGNVTRDSVKKDEEEFMRVVEGRAKGNDGKLKYVDVNCPVIVNCQVGLSRSTTGCVSAGLFREFQLSASYEGLVETVPGVNLDVLRMDNYQMDKDKVTLFRGEFEVVKELTQALGDEGVASKRECDKVIDKNGPAPKGTGIKQLRENIAESKLSYEIMDDAAQAFLKTKIMDNLVALASNDFHKNLGKIIHDIYLTGHNLFKDMPQGDHKKRAKYRFASKTLMRILPDNLKSEVEGLINQKNITLDLYEILGQCTWGQAKSL